MSVPVRRRRRCSPSSPGAQLMGDSTHTSRHPISPPQRKILKNARPSFDSPTQPSTRLALAQLLHELNPQPFANRIQSHEQAYRPRKSGRAKAQTTSTMRVNSDNTGSFAGTQLHLVSCDDHTSQRETPGALSGFIHPCRSLESIVCGRRVQVVS